MNKRRPSFSNQVILIKNYFGLLKFTYKGDEYEWCHFLYFNFLYFMQENFNLNVKSKAIYNSIHQQLKGWERASQKRFYMLLPQIEKYLGKKGLNTFNQSQNT